MHLITYWLEGDFKHLTSPPVLNKHRVLCGVGEKYETVNHAISPLEKTPSSTERAKRFKAKKEKPLCFIVVV
jgi:hypothetical protein